MTVVRMTRDKAPKSIVFACANPAPKIYATIPGRLVPTAPPPRDRVRARKR